MKLLRAISKAIDSFDELFVFLAMIIVIVLLIGFIIFYVSDARSMKVDCEVRISEAYQDCQRSYNNE